MADAAAWAEATRLASRPLKFFPHDADAFEDIKCQRLFDALGWEGYGRWWRLCELLSGADGHEIRVDGRDAGIWARRLGLSVEGLVAFAELLADCGLVELSDGSVTSPRMTANARYAGICKVNGSKGGRPRKTS